MAMCNCYWGCQGTTQKVCWALMILFGLAGVALIGASIGVVAPIGDDFEDCIDECSVKHPCATTFFLDDCDVNFYEYDDKTVMCRATKSSGCCDDCEDDAVSDWFTFVGLCVTGCIIAAIASCPCYFFCCCAQNPHKAAPVVITAGQPVAYPAVQMVPMAAQPMAAYPTAAQPMGYTPKV